MLIYLAMLETDEERNDFSEYYEKHYGRCLAVAYDITQNHTWAEEAVQNAFMKMLRHKEKYFSDLGKRTASTIVIMVRSESLDLIKHEKRFKHFDLDEVEPIIADKSPDAFRIVASKEAADCIRKHISSYDRLNKTIFEMKFMERADDGEIAEITGLTKNAVALRIHKMRNVVKEILRKEGFTDD